MGELITQWPHELSEGVVIRRSDRAIFRNVEDGSGLVLHLDTADYFGLNQVGSAVWNLLGEGIRWPALIEGMQAEFADPPASLEQDVADFLQQLHERRLIELVAQP